MASDVAAALEPATSVVPELAASDVEAAATGFVVVGLEGVVSGDVGLAAPVALPAAAVAECVNAGLVELSKFPVLPSGRVYAPVNRLPVVPSARWKSFVLWTFL